MILLGLILLTTKVIDAANYGQLSPITFTSENVEMIDLSIRKGEKDQLYDGSLDHDFLTLDPMTPGVPMKIKFNMGQINCVNKLETFFNSALPNTVSISFTCTSKECTCGGAYKSMCSLFSFSITSTENIPGDLPEKTDCIYGDTATLETDMDYLRIGEIILTGYQPQDTAETDETEDCEKTKSCLSDATSVAVAGVPFIAVLRLV